MTGDYTDEVACGTEGCIYIFLHYSSEAQKVADRSPCPVCGGNSRQVSVSLYSPLSMHSTLHISAYPAGPKSNRRRFAWGMTGYERSEALGRLVKKESLFDKRQNRRFEHIEDPVTGKILRTIDHPLTEHRGHGSAKNRSD